MGAVERQAFVAAAEALRLSLRAEATAMGKRVPEDGSSPGIKYRRTHAQTMIGHAIFGIERVLSGLTAADEAVQQAAPWRKP